MQPDQVRSPSVMAFTYIDLERSAKVTADMYTIDGLNIKMYVLNDRRLAPLIMKAHNTLSFRPFIKVTADKLAGNSKPACDLFDGPLLDDYSHSIRMTLSPGTALDEMNLRMAHEAAAAIGNLVHGGVSNRKTIKLFEWSRHTVVQATSCGAFGPRHPFLDAKVERAFW